MIHLSKTLCLLAISETFSQLLTGAMRESFASGYEFGRCSGNQISPFHCDVSHILNFQAGYEY